MMVVRRPAFAKVNLGLRILDKRPDGFHELRTVFQTVSLADDLTVSFEPGGRRRVQLTCDRAELCGADNLAAQAASRLLSLGPWRGKVLIDLVKKIPAGSGLGGGSSDAGAVLLALARLLEPVPTEDQLHEAAVGVGSDVPFFLVGGRALGLGRGEELYPLSEPLRRQWLLLVVPSLHIATAEAYTGLAQARSGELTSRLKRLIIREFCAGVGPSGQTEVSALARALVNDFEDVIFRNFPELEQYKCRIQQAGALGAALSGSGSALFGLFSDNRTARAAARKLKGAEAETFVVHTVGRREYHDARGRVGRGTIKP